MSFNLRFGSANDGANSWEFRRKRTAECIRIHSPDVVCTQEVLRWQYDELLRLLGPPYVGVFAGRDDGKDAGEACAIIFNCERVYCTGAPVTFWLSETPDKPGSRTPTWRNPLPRICTQAHFLFLPAYRGFHVMNTHLDHESRIAQEKSVQLLLARRPRDEPLLVCGDFNAAPDSACVSAVAHEMVHTLAEVKPEELKHATFHDFTGRDGGSPMHIDYIFASSGVELLGASVDRTLAGVPWPSDHFPVLAHVRWA